MASWTLDELAGRAALALSVGYPGQASGRVRDVPDQRAIRYYTTLGLVDRPAGMRGRTALYGRRHLLQLVAIKRLQAEGLTLAQVQAELAGCTQADLERIARLPDGLTAEAPAVASAPARAPTPAAAPTPARTRFWTAPTTVPERVAGPRPAAMAAGPAPKAAVAAPSSADARPAAPPQEAAPTTATAWSLDAMPAAPPADRIITLQGVDLGDGVMLLVAAPRPLGADDLAALRAAAGPLRTAVRARGLDRPAPDREDPA